MENKTYLQKIQTLKKEIYNIQFDKIQEKGLLGTYLMISANLSTFLPHLKDDEHYKFIQNMQFHRSLSGIDQYFPFLLDKLKIEDKFNIVEHSYNKGHIFVTYHTGSHRMFIQYLAHKNIPFCLVAEDRFIKEQGVTTQKLFKEMSNNDRNKELQLLSAENPRLIFELIKKLREGISVVIYIDGNTGSTKKRMSKNKNLQKINFLNHHVYARQGVAFLAYLSKSPMAVVVAKRDGKLNNLIKINPIKTVELIQKYDRNDFINIITQKLYKKLERFIKNDFEQWDGWFYFQKYFDIDNPIINLNLEKRDAKFATFQINQFIQLIKHDDKNTFLVMKKYYQIMKITKFLYDVLFFFKKPQTITSKKSLVIHNQKVNWNIVTELIEMNYLKLI